jgi:hypothetical protein
LQYLFYIDLVPDDKGVPQAQLRGWFGELSSRRQSGMGMNPITYCEIKAWADLTGRNPSPLEVAALVALDSLFINVLSRKDG